MTPRGPFQPLLFCDSVIPWSSGDSNQAFPCWMSLFLTRQQIVTLRRAKGPPDNSVTIPTAQSLFSTSFENCYLYSTFSRSLVLRERLGGHFDAGTNDIVETSRIKSRLVPALAMLNSRVVLLLLIFQTPGQI